MAVLLPLKRLGSCARQIVLSRFFTTPNAEEGIIRDKDVFVEVVPPEQLIPVCGLNGIPSEQLLRTARIFIPSASAMQSGTNNVRHWTISFDTQERWENPLMGWSSSADPQANISLSFDTKEEAIAFVVKQGWQYEIEEPKKAKFQSKSYGANFSWDKKTRVTTK